MNKSIIRFILCKVLQFAGVFMMLPALVALIYKEHNGIWFLIVGVASFILGTVGALFKPTNKVFYAREGFVTVSLSWILLSLVGALPFTLSGEIPSYIDAIFETVSGFTTTGASILTDVEAMSQSAMFWRCFTNWVGGMGVLVFIMAIVPLSGGPNMHLMRAESPGPEVGKLVPKVKDTAKILYGIYLGLTVILFVSYLLTGMKLYDAMIITFATMGTGGFANLNASVGGYSNASQIVAIVFMVLCGINFNAYFYLLRRKGKDFWKIEEVRWYLGFFFAVTAIIAYQIRNIYPTVREAIHHAAFQSASIMTTTGFSSADFDLWPTLSKSLLVMLMIIGACAGSTGGGIKVSRVVIAIRIIGRELSHLTHPRSVKKVKFNGQTVSEDTVKSVSSYMLAYVLVVVISTLIVAIDGFDFTTTITSIFATLGNIGPGLALVGPCGNYAAFSDLSKIVLSIDMLTGRLEIFPILVLLYAGTWRKS